VPLSPLARDVIAKLPKIESATGLVFTISGRPLGGFAKAKARLDQAMARIAVAEGGAFTPFILHDLRRTAASTMAELGVAPHQIEAVLNHRSGIVSGIAAVYNKFEYREEKRMALERLAATYCPTLTAARQPLAAIAISPVRSSTTKAAWIIAAKAVCN
jgi:hypothetical protein